MSPGRLPDMLSRAVQGPKSSALCFCGLRSHVVSAQFLIHVCCSVGISTWCCLQSRQTHVTCTSSERLTLFTSLGGGGGREGRRGNSTLQMSWPAHSTAPGSRPCSPRFPTLQAKHRDPTVSESRRAGSTLARRGDLTAEETGGGTGPHGDRRGTRRPPSVRGGHQGHPVFRGRKRR